MTEETKVSPMEQFKTAKYHSESQKMPLFTPDGKETEHYIMVIGSQSPIMRKKKQELITQAAKSIKEGGWNDEVQSEFTNELLTCAVTGWSFEEELTADNVKQFLIDAPEIKESIDVFCNQNSNYYQKKSMV